MLVLDLTLTKKIEKNVTALRLHKKGLKTYSLIFSGKVKETDSDLTMQLHMVQYQALALLSL